MIAFPLDIAIVALGGALGGVGRVWLSERVTRRLGDRFPWGTLVVNVSGAAAIGLIAGWLHGGGGHAGEEAVLRLALIAGFVGSYTTVSSFSLQTHALIRAGDWRAAGANVVASVGLSLAAAAAGFLLVSRLAGGAP